MRTALSAILSVAFALLCTAAIAEEPASPTVAKPAESIEGKYLSNVRQVTSGMLKAGEGYFSPDGKTIIYQAVPLDYPFYQIYTQPLEGARPRLISSGKGRTTCAYFHPSDERVIFASSHLDPNLGETEAAERARQDEDRRTGKRRRYSWDFDPWMEIFEAKPDGTILRRLTDSKGYDAEGAYSPDGSQIAFSSDRDGDCDLFVMNADGSDLRKIVTGKGYDGGPFISPDGKRVVYRTDRKAEGFLQIHVVDIDGKNDVALTDNHGVNWAPYWHPTKPYIIWTGADHSKPDARPNYDLYAMKYEIKDGKIAPGPITRITDHAGADVLPVFSPDGKQLMWTSGRTEDHQSQLFIADLTLPE